MRRILVIGALLTQSLTLSAQELSAVDSIRVQEVALRHVKQFEGLLNLIAQPDKYFRKYSFAKLVQSFYREQSDYQIFRDSLVAVEDNLNPSAHPDADNFLSIKNYLEAFFSFYEKSPVNSVFFSNYEVSPVKQGEFTYVEVFYQSEFTNRHRAYPDQPYPVRYSKATLRAQQKEGDWQVFISNINYYQPDGVPAPVIAEEQTPEPEPIYQASISTLPQAADRKASLPSAPRDDEPIKDLSDALSDSTGTWEVLDRLDRGSDYQLRLYDSISVLKPVGQLAFVSSPAALKTKTNKRESSAEAFKRFAPLIRRVGASSVQVAFDNPAEAPLSVELINSGQGVLFSEKVPAQQSYARAINLENLEEGAYRIRVSNGDYEHTVRINYQTSEMEGVQKSHRVFADFRPYIMKREDHASAQVVFKNPSEDALLVELVDMSGLVLYSEEVASNQSYGRSISLENLYEGSYRIRISHPDYQHTVRIYHRSVAKE